MGYGHYHVSLVTKDVKLNELIIFEEYGAHLVQEWSTDKTLDTFENIQDAVTFAVKYLKNKYNGEILRGAGCPPDRMLEEAEK